MLWSKMSPRNLADDWKLIGKFCWRRGRRLIGGRGGGRENLF